MKSITQIGYNMVDAGLIPDIVLKIVARHLCRQRLREIDHGSLEANHEAKMHWIEQVKALDTIAVKTEKANEQHYEVPTKFMLSCLGPRAVYSGCLYPTGKESLSQAEELVLDDYCVKAQLKDGMDILDLGCGWGSLTLFLAQKYPNSRIVGLSNSHSQRMYIMSRVSDSNLTNVEVYTGDINTSQFTTDRTFDRIISIGMFEHMKNYEALFRKVSAWLRAKSQTKEPSNGDEALLFVHVFCHKQMPYHFEEDDGWMAQTIFSGGTMPSFDLFQYFQSDLTLTRSWFVNGMHYSRTMRDWLKRQDSKSKDGLAALDSDCEIKGLSLEEGRKTFNRFRVFFIAAAEMFAMNGGQEWGVGYYLFKKKPE